MKIGILGSGVVGQVLGAKLVERGHDVVLGTRRPDALDDQRGMGAPLRDWLEKTNQKGVVGRFDEAAAHGEVVINATSGQAALSALEMAGPENLAGKVLIDVSNPLDFSQGFPPTLTVCNTDSLGEQIQRKFPQAKVVKTLNTTTAAVMVDPEAVGDGEHHLFVCGDDAGAKTAVVGYLRDWFGWKEVIDVGDITSSRGTEMLLPLWVRLMGALGSPMFNFRIVR